MQECNLHYIPERLRKGNKNILDYFEVGEFLYRRCDEKEMENPFATPSIAELSHNRGGLKENILCEAGDVLYNINIGDEFEKYEDKKVCTLVIKDLNEQKKYKKAYIQEKDSETYNCVIELLHEPDPCMYPHCVFRVWLGNEIVTPDNHKKKLGKLHQIRNSLREELASMIVKKQVSQSDSPIVNSAS